MSAQDQLEMVRKAQKAEKPVVVAAGPKTIVVHVQSDNSVDSRLETALSLARASSAHVECLHITPIEAYVAFDSLGGVFVMNDVIKALDEEQANLRSRIEAKLQNEDVSWSYQQLTGNVASQLISFAALADLLVVGRQPHRSDFVGSAISLIGDLIYRCRTPLLIPADSGQPVDPTGTAVIAWDGSYEAANAVRSSVGLLKLASTIHVLQVAERDKDETFPSTRLLEYLSRHGIHAELSTVEPLTSVRDRDLISEAVLAWAQEKRAAYLVMGGYNHSRVGEFLFGGVTRTLLAGSPIPIVIAR
jgi:nucleotide-binding universal stress UspA family protein